MKRSLLLISICLVGVVLILKEGRIERPSGVLKDGCLFCHKEMTDPDPSHPVPIFGCAVCHLGNRYSSDRERAHFGIVRNPGDLRIVDRTCGKSGCHPDMADRVKKSVMATNSGMIQIIQEQWLERAGPEDASPMVSGLHVSDLYENTPPWNLAIDHYRKMCGGCHLWKPRGDGGGEVARRGGGCSDCHALDQVKREDPNLKMNQHPVITTRIPSANCTKCHNRSARIGLSYFGRFESAGYGTPYEGSGLNRRRLSGNRFFMELQADVHFRKAGMECIDCHTATGLMGDGNAYDRMKDQLDITCEACHSPMFSLIETSDSLAGRLAFLNKRVPGVAGRSVGFTKKGTPIYNLQEEGEGIFFYRKMDGFPIEMNVPSPEKPHHRLGGHERLSCQACHAAWIPQCYGCHLTYTESEAQTDWLTREKSPGRWKESRSYIRFSRPSLGIRDDREAFPLSPCQMFVSVIDETGEYRKERSFKVINLSAFDPHTTAAKSRTCIECHEDPKVMGLGEGILHQKNGRRVFRPTGDAADSGMGLSHPLDAYVNLDGKPLQTGFKNGVRPFTGDEIDRILGVVPCLGCHPAYDDPIYRNFQESKRRFQREEAGLPCLK
ncbi:MAG: hypothetical protein K9N21_12520 [Deltaproteobacteria bacterium]|nr:hypothetical protein [Deltaproteobacteria bacterium]